MIRTTLHLDRGSAPDPGSVARGGPFAPLRSLAGAPCAPPSWDPQRVQSSRCKPHNGPVGDAAARGLPHLVPFGSEWRRELPVLSAPGVSLRELQATDRDPLLTLLGSGAVAKFIAPPPDSRAAFERFVRWSLVEQGAAVANGRANAALAKLGAIRETVVRRGVDRRGARHDQALWSITRDTWRAAPAPTGAPIH